MYKNQGLAASFRNAGRGFMQAVCSERNLRIHLVSVFYVFIAAYMAKLALWQAAAILLCCGLVITVELLNTAIEKMCDAFSEKYNGTIKMIKDVSAGAVLTGAVTAVILAGMFFLNKPALTNIFTNLKSHWVLIAGLLLSIPIAVIFIIGKEKNK